MIEEASPPLFFVCRSVSGALFHNFCSNGTAHEAGGVSSQPCDAPTKQDCHIVNTRGGLGFGQIYAGTKEGWAQI